MPLCRKCNTKFPNRLEINGRFRNVQHRKYCLSCSPFGQHNTRQLHGLPAFEPISGLPELDCRLCGRHYVLDRRKGHRRTMCNSCNANIQRRRRKANAVTYKGERCCLCGYNKCLRALEFHHRERDHKEFSIARMMSMSWAKVKKELDKCDLICSNCHREEEDRIAGSSPSRPTARTHAR
jgi:hypothetical protein